MEWIEHYYNRVVKEMDIALRKLDQSITSATGLIGVLIPLQWLQMSYALFIFFPEMVVLALFILKDSERYQYFMRWNRIIYAIERKKFLLEEVDYMNYIRTYDFSQKTNFPITLKYAIARRLKKVYFWLLLVSYSNTLTIEIYNITLSIRNEIVTWVLTIFLVGFGILLIILLIWILRTKKLPKEFDYNENMKKVYYAHSKLIYNTKREKKELQFLRNKFTSVCNPNTDITWDNTTKMEPFFKAVKNSDIIIISEYKKHIGKGVYDEIKLAINSHISVLCLRKKLFKYRLHQVASVELVDEKNWKIKYGKVILCS